MIMHNAREIVDEPIDAYGAEAATAAPAERLADVRSSAVRVACDGRDLLAPPFTPGRDRVDGPPWGRSTLVVFGAHGTPSPRPLGRVLAAEAAAAQGRFRALTSELLSSRHDDPADLEAAMVRAGLDAARTLVAMRAGTVADRILADTASALASGVVHAPALFIDGEQYRGELVPAEVSAAWDMTR